MLGTQNLFVICRAISAHRLKSLRTLHLASINVVISHGSCRASLPLVTDITQIHKCNTNPRITNRILAFVIPADLPAGRRDIGMPFVN